MSFMALTQFSLLKNKCQAEMVVGYSQIFAHRMHGKRHGISRLNSIIIVVSVTVRSFPCYHCAILFSQSSPLPRRSCDLADASWPGDGLHPCINSLHCRLAAAATLMVATSVLTRVPYPGGNSVHSRSQQVKHLLVISIFRFHFAKHL